MSGEKFMKKHKSKIEKSNIKFVKVKTGTVDNFFSTIKNLMRSADEGKIVESRCATLTFADPAEMLHFLSAAKIKLIKSIRSHPDTVTNIAKIIKRDRSSVNRDILELKKFGLVKIHEEINPGHGRHKIVELTSPLLKLEAII
jgi:predicted transcriptional regulator